MVTGDPQSVYDFYREHCPALPQPGCSLSIAPGCDCDIADAPLRLWRNTSGAINALASVDLGSRGFVSTAGTVSTLRHSCHVYANSTDDHVFPLPAHPIESC
jgi:hypothetical protein